jgi:hypothetical protein
LDYVFFGCQVTVEHECSEQGEGCLKKRSISAKALVEDVGNGLSDTELMSRYELSYGQLQKFFVQLIDAGYVTQEALNRRTHDQTKPASDELGVNGVQTTVPDSSEMPHSVQPESQHVALSPHLPPELGKCQAGALSLPMTREQASQARRNGLILILACYGLLTMQLILYKIQEGAELGSFPRDGMGALLLLITPVIAIVGAVLGCLWRVRGLGQHAAWAIVAPLFWINVIVMEALPNRYEPHSDRRSLRLAFAVAGVAAWWIALSQVVKLL